MASSVETVNPRDLEVEDLNITSALMTGASLHYGEYCRSQNDKFMACRFEGKDPRKCLEEGRHVTECGMKFFSLLKQHCNEEFTAYWTCLDENNQEFKRCRKAQKKYDACVLQKLGLERPKIS